VGFRLKKLRMEVYKNGFGLVTATRRNEGSPDPY